MFLVSQETSIGLSFGDKIKKMTTVLYNKQRKESVGLILDPELFKATLENADSGLLGFFDEMCDILIPNNRSAYNQKEDQKKVVAILHLMAGLRNKHVNNFKLELGMYLVAAGATTDAVNALHNAGVSVTYQTVHSYKRNIAAEHSKRVKEYFIKNVSTW
jgi:hypothetical protein